MATKALNPIEVEASRKRFADDSLVSLFEEAARHHSYRIAAICGSSQVTYAELDRAANRMARRLIASCGDGRGIVAIYLDRSIEMLAAMLGVLKSGSAYLPIDPGYPAARVMQTLEDANPLVVITNQKLASSLGKTTQILLVDELPSSDATDTQDIQLRSKPDDLAYVMFTSGSTGKPKGVLVSHRNVVRLLSETEAWFHFNETDVWTMFHSFAFDFSVWEIWGPLTTGGKLVIVPFATSRSPEDFYALLSEQKVTVLNQTPSAFSLLNQLEESGTTLPLSLRVVIFGGEALQYRSLRNWFKRHGDVRPQLVNMYGITETTVHVTYRVVCEADTQGEQDSLIGVSIPDLQIHLLNADLVPVAEGEVGEICVGGGGVAHGYLNRPELTAERFVPDPFGPLGAKLYRSGDLAKLRADGELVYLGRGDNQVKINGFRIELGEVEAAISDFPGVRQVSVIGHITGDGSQALAAYFVMAGSERPMAGDMSRFLSQRLPAQMMPSFYIQMEAIPLTSNGKVDRAALPKPATGSTPVATGVQKTSDTPLQIQIAEVWRNVLKAPQVGVDDNFFDIGGTSVLLATVRSQLQEKLGRSIPVTWMFEFTTIRTLAEKFAETGDSPVKSSATLDAAQEQARKQREAFARMRSTKGTAR
ncbi:MAG: amino acid adenylation domain-containing protein [Acidobacteria bacterium]|nr:amino acid adenylation domain-containing protein [Acidobacteriota bacterium]